MVESLKNVYISEELFVHECLKRDIPISKPLFNTEPYDFICEVRGRFISVQVKTAYEGQRGARIACLKNSYPGSSAKHYVSEREIIDFLAIYERIDDLWYIIPREAFQNVKSAIGVSQKGKYGRYINNFNFDN